MIEDFLPPRPKQPEAVPVPIETDTTITYDEEPDFAPPERFESSNFDTSTNNEPAIDSSAQSHKLEDKTFSHPTPPKKKRFKFKKPDLTRKQWIIAILMGLLVVGLLSFLTWKIFAKEKPAVKTEPPVVQKEEPPQPTVYYSKLTGAAVSEAQSNLPVTAVMIENSPDARPQSGLKDAGVVYEAVAEGGITRFLTLFQEAQPDYMGPVRSVRPYYLDWLVPFDAPVAHVGGSAEALAQIRAEGIKDLDYAFNSSAYQRVSSRYAPHNVYTSRANLLGLHNAKGWNTSSFTGWARKEEKASATPTAKSIDFSISGFLYNPHFDYDPVTNSYKRSQAGKPHIDEKSGVQISPKVVVAIVLPKGIHPDGVHTTYNTFGSGKAYFFQDGVVTEGIWEKKDRKSEMRFGDANGAVFALNRGNTWISAVGEAGSVTYAP